MIARAFPRTATLLLGALAAGLSCARAQDTPVDADVVLRGGTLVDGSGAPARPGDVAIRGGRIVAVGRFDIGQVGRIVDCRGLVVAPGFVDLHNHGDRTILRPRNRGCEGYLTQGVTTIVTGNCGSGRADVGAYLDEVDRAGVGVHVAHLVPHGSVRRVVMGDAARAANPVERRRMRDLVVQGLREGAFGMSTGLYYVPGAFADRREILELARAVAQVDGLYATHMRHEDERLLESIEETLQVARETEGKVHVSHLKARGARARGLMEKALAAIEEARAEELAVTADQYPYTAASSSLSAYLAPAWAREGGTARLRERLIDQDAYPRIQAAILDRLEVYPDLRIAAYPPRPEWSGKGLAAIAREQDVELLDVVLEILDGGDAQVVNFAMREEDVRLVMRRPWVATASDGAPAAPGPGRPHPRSYGAFARKIGRYALREKVVSLEAAVRSASGLPADVLGLRDRGYLRAGMAADVVVFDPREYVDRATFEKPFEPASGVRWVFVAGQAALAEGKLTGVRAGRALRRR